MERHVQHASRVESLNASSDAITITRSEQVTKPPNKGRPPSLKAAYTTFDPRFEIGSRTSNGLSISFANTDQIIRGENKSNNNNNNGITVTPARTPSSYIQNIPSRGGGGGAPLFAMGGVGGGEDKRIINKSKGPIINKPKPFNNFIVNYNN
jgi:hypothetical protein